MKYYEYKQTQEKKRSELFERHGVFFAFSKSQMDEKIQSGVKYYSLGGGMFIPQDSFDLFKEEGEALSKNTITEAKKLFTPTEIISYELGNHEYCITYDLTETQEALEEFNFSDDEYKTSVKDYLSSCEF